ncbi:MAG: HpcH/HpaI aldolase/citrate lyase family protein [Pseudomonadales bacterium]
MPHHRLRRCHLTVPGSNAKMLEKSLTIDVDVIVIDLEDAVAPQEKSTARTLVADHLANATWQAPTLSVRINDVGSHHCFQDVIALIEAAGKGGRCPDTLILPKTQTVTDIKFLDQLLAQVESAYGIGEPTGIEALIEDAKGMININEIAAGSPRLEALIFGMGDFAASQQMPMLDIGNQGAYPGDLWHYPRSRLVMAARAHGLVPIDGPFADYKDTDGLIADSQTGKLMGLSGKWAIHPNQAPLISECFSPDQADVARARAQKAAYQAALKAGQGAVSVDGVMVDQATMKLIEPLLTQADLLKI